MSIQDEICEWLLLTVRLVVDHPEQVAIEAVPGDECTTLRIKVTPGDIGKVIGKQGRTSQSLRTLTAAAGMKVKWRFIVEIDEGKER
jgi:uncharacterized protein